MAFGSSSGSGKKTRGGAIADINVTPLVDILLVLLIIFMVTAPTVHHGARLPTPDISPSDPKQPDQQEEKDTVALDRQGQLRFRGQVFSLDKLYQLVKTDPQLQTTRELFLKADLELPYGQVMEVIGSLRRAGIQKLGVVVVAEDLGLVPTPRPPDRR